MSTSSGQSGYSLQQPNPANPNGYGGPNMRYGDTNVDRNMFYANQNLPGTPFSYQQQAAGLYGTPFQSNPNQYGRWNWASQPGAGAAAQPGGYQPGPGAPPIPPGTPPPGNLGSPPIPPSSTAQPQAQGLFNMSRDEQMNAPYSQAAIAQGMNQGGDIWSNPAFANAVAGAGSGGLFGPSAASQAALQQRMLRARGGG